MDHVVFSIEVRPKGGDIPISYGPSGFRRGIRAFRIADPSPKVFDLGQCGLQAGNGHMRQLP